MEPAPHVIWNNEAEERAGTPLVVMFHGYGSHEGDLMALSASLPAGLSIASVRAPQRAGAGFQWFPLSSELGFTTVAVVAAAEPVVRWLRDEALQHTHVVLLLEPSLPMHHKRKTSTSVSVFHHHRKLVSFPIFYKLFRPL